MFLAPNVFRFLFILILSTGEAGIRRLLGRLASSRYPIFASFVSVILQDISDGEVIEMSSPDIEAEVNARERV